MNNDRKEELLTRWMDDGLSEKEMKELEPILASSPELHEERARFLRLRERLRDSVPRELDPPFPDYFNSHLEKLVKAENAAPGLKEDSGAFSAFNRRWLWWMGPAVTCAVVFAFLLGMKSAQSGNASSGLVGSGSNSEVYSPKNPYCHEFGNQTFILFSSTYLSIAVFSWENKSHETLKIKKLKGIVI